MNSSAQVLIPLAIDEPLSPSQSSHQEKGVGRERPRKVDLSSVRTIDQILRVRAQEQQHQHALTYLVDGETQEASMTYGDLDRQARAIAALLQSFEAKGERAVLLYGNSLSFAAAFFGCLYAGTVAVPVRVPRSSRHVDHFRAIIGDAQATIVLTETALLRSLHSLLKQDPLLHTLRWIPTNSLPTGVEENWREDATLRSETLAFLQYTSGSTRTPRGVQVSHANLLDNEAAITARLRCSAESVGVIWLPPHHDMGLIGGIVQPIYAGFPCILLSPLHFMQRPVRWLQAISRYQGTVSGGPNGAYDFCVQRTTDEYRSHLNLCSWQTAFCGAEPIRSETITRFAAAFGQSGFRAEAFYPCYGLAEATLFIAGRTDCKPPLQLSLRKSFLEHHQVRESEQGASSVDTITVVSCGKVIEGHAIAIVNPDDGTPCAPGRVGEIWVSGPSVAHGYWEKEHDSRVVFYARLVGEENKLFLRTGDLGFLHNGELFVTGRLKELIIIQGRNLYPHDVEWTVARCWPTLRPPNCGAALSLPGPNGESLAIVQEIDNPQTQDLPAVMRTIRQAIATEHEVQADLVVLVRTGTIPKTSSGKIQRYRCRELLLAEQLPTMDRFAVRPSYFSAGRPR